MITLEEILTAKEKRQQRQRLMLERWGLTLVSITINMPGTIKDSPLLRELLDFAVHELASRIEIVAQERSYLSTGPEALLVVAQAAWEAKQSCVAVEEAESFSRLLDLDVFANDGTQLSRQEHGEGRCCFLCKEVAVSCMRERRHSLAEIVDAATDLLSQFAAHQTRLINLHAEKLGALAIEAMLYEVTCTPAPGLVDRVNSGAHSDMDFYTFMASSAALATTLARCAQAGVNHCGNPEELLPILRYIGQEGESLMLSATRNINTQKGLLFSLGIIAAAVGHLYCQGNKASTEQVLNYVAAMVKGIVSRELSNLNKSADLTAGERLYRQYGVTGIRGELEAGLPTVLGQALPEMRRALTNRLSVNDALLQVLVVLMTCVDDTTVMHRHHPDTMRVWVKNLAQAALAEGGMYTEAGRSRIAAMDEEFIAHNVSPGGVADLLAVTWFLYRVEGIDWKA